MAYQPKSYRKFAATTATAAMVASAVAPVASLAAGFTDVAPQYKDAVDFLVSTGATNGKTETQFGVYEQITRLDAAVILAKVLKLDVDNAKDAGFTDVPKDRAKYVNALVEAGILNGKSEGKFGAYDNLTRVEMAKIIANAYKLEKQNDNALPFTDVNATWAPFVKALYDNGVTSGKTETSFGAYENITRGDFARFVYRAANLNVDVDPEVVSVSAIDAKGNVVAIPGTDIPANAKFEIKFSKDVDPSTIVTGNIYLTQDGVKQLATVSYDANKKVAVLALNTGTTLEAGKEYVLTVDGVKSKDGATVAKFTEKFTVSNNPIVISVQYDKDRDSSLDNFEGVLLPSDGNTLKFTFNKDMIASTMWDYSNVKLFDITDNKYVTIPSLSVGGTGDRELTVTLPTLTSKHEYRLEFAGLKSLDGAQIVPFSEKFIYDVTAPTLGSLSPSNNATGVYNKITASGGNEAFKWKAQFSSAVDASTVNNSTVKLKEKATGNEVEATVTYEAGSRYVIIAPKADLKENTEYEVVIDGVKSDKGIKVAKATYTFTTGDFTAPTVVSSTPANGTDGVKVDGAIVLNFSEKMKESTLTLGTNIELKDLTTNNLVNISTWNGSLSQDGKTFTIKMPSNVTLDPNKTYELKVKKDVVTDVAGNGLEKDYVVRFATEQATATKLVNVQKGSAFATTNTVVETGATNFGTADKLYFNFDKALKAEVVGTYELENLVKVEELQANGTYRSVPTTINLVNSSKTIEIVNGSGWGNDKTYRITIPTSVKDVNGNDVQKVEFTFTTGTKPAVDTVKSSPANFATGVAVNTPYVAVVIDDAESDLKSSTLNSDNVKFVKKSDGTAAPYSLEYVNYAKKTDTPAIVAVGGANEFTVAAQDIAKFKVGDILTFSGGTTGTVVVTAVDPATNKVTVNKNLVGVSTGNTVTFHQGVVFKLNANQKLAGNTEYQIQVKDVLDAAGNKVDAKNITFTTAADYAKLNLESSSVNDGATGVKVDTPVKLTFNEKLANLNAITVTDGLGNDITSSFNIDYDTNNEKVVVVEPKGFWKANTVYKITVAANATSVAGDSSKEIGTAQTISFQTEATASVKPKITEAKWYDANGNNKVDQGDLIRVSFNTVLNGTGIDNIADFTLAGGTIASSSNVTYPAGKKYVDIVIGADAAGDTTSVIAGVTTIAISTGDATTPATWTDGVGNDVSTDSVVIVKN
ncbi:hypothetical protein GTID1_11770 [Geobacillus thermodenitrificans]|uniref:Ig-like domain-containing protein n=1 Tax=Geobacillus thermodenitrificans TaxID=33940 RepID=UPI000C05A3FB|nr:Ig-like domain-containing protein [Geobacillus thermodenitrificans]ATO37813.1 hypothetical protein GTID1_11770 [Geobacillus thermodenitrificans]